MKRFFALFSCLVLIVALTACSVASRPASAVKQAGGNATVAASAVKLQNGLHSLRIAIDPGHGGIDNGAVGTDTGVHEDTLNLEIAELVAKQFMLNGADVLMTRKSEDVDYTGDGNTLKRKDMNNRAKLINAQNPQVVVSIHMNKYPNRSLSGAQVFFEKGSMEGEKLAVCIQDALNSGLDSSKQRLAKSGDYFILKASASPSVIVECGFLSNHNEEKKLLDPDYRQKLGDCIYKGICSYLGVK